MRKNNTKKLLITTAVVVLTVVVFAFLYFYYDIKRVDTQSVEMQAKASLDDDINSDVQSSFFVNKKTNTIPSKENFRVEEVSHLATPESVKGLYMTSWVAGTNNLRDKVISIVDNTEANSIVVDLKDYSGHISYPVENAELNSLGSVDKRIPNLKYLTNLLHSKGIYVIGRIACFQDPYFVSLHPEFAMKQKTNHDVIWTDKKGLSWLDPGEETVWNYLIDISKDAYEQGVDEIQFDYTRFPSDGDMKNIYYPSSEGKKRAEVINDFWKYLNENLKDTSIVTSVDLFGLSTTSNDDLGIGQLLENALVNFDYVSPMVYPSHFAPGWRGFSDPQSHPYDIVKISMDSAVARAKTINVSVLKLRPWLQDFGLAGETYGEKEVRAQIQATYDSGLNSWLLWDASNTFTPQALLP